jgi:hypothetical protein
VFTAFGKTLVHSNTIIGKQDKLKIPIRILQISFDYVAKSNITEDTLKIITVGNASYLSV